ncbi:RIIa domain-containing protein 1-like [Hydractinia symbiolongicarpus]|uniref:RIIa domain-containing protein 1-like n=1 Tax=Hydractinia symbiolongicarpus TaxID=13093 RepID=UPI00254C606E|nr:RIIa domain-containing protein 1-like [Hydractinia symbiolongicarpus]
MDDKRATEKNDIGALTDDQQTKLNSFKVKTRISNEKYLRDHPEVDCLIQSFVSDVCNKRPQNVREFAADYFTDPELALKIKAMTQKKQSAVKNSQNKQV